MDKDEIINKLKDHKTTLSTLFGIVSIGLFGSYARDCASERSDIDLVYITRPDIRIGFAQKIQLESYLAHLLQPASIDMVNYKYMNPIIKSDMEKYVIYV